MVLIHQRCSLCLNSFFNKFRVRKNATAGQVSCKFFSWHYLNPLQNGKKKYYSTRKPGKVLPMFLGWKYRLGYSAESQIRNNSSSYVKGLSENKINKSYSITVTSLKAVLGSKEFIIKKTIGKPKNIAPLSFIQIEKSKTEEKIFESDFKQALPSRSSFSSKLPQISEKTNSTHHELSNLNSFDFPVNLDGDQKSSIRTNQSQSKNDLEYKMFSVQPNLISESSLLKMDLREYIKNLTSNENSFDKNINKLCSEERNMYYSPLDTIILNPNDPQARIILYFKNKNVHVIESSDFDYLNEAHQCLMQASKITPKKPSRINFIKFEKIKTGDKAFSQHKEIAPYQSEFDGVVLKRQDSICLEDTNDKLWIPICPDQQTLPEVTPENIKGQALPVNNKKELASGEDNSDPYVTKIPIKKNTLIDENVVPSRSILDILNSIDRSAVIIQKDLYITDRIMQKIKNEKKKEKKQEKPIEAKGISLSKSKSDHLNFSATSLSGINSPVLLSETDKHKGCELLVQEHLCNLKELNSKYKTLLQSVSKIINLATNIELFSLNDSPIFKGISTTDIIKKAASILNKERYAQNKMTEKKKADHEKHSLKKDLSLQRPDAESTSLSKTRDKCSDINEPLLSEQKNFNIMKLDTAVSLTQDKSVSLEKSVQEENVQPPNIDNFDLNVREISPFDVNLKSSQNSLENNPGPLEKCEIVDNEISMITNSEPLLYFSADSECRKHLTVTANIETENELMDNKNAIHELVSFESKPWVDKSVESLMCSKTSKDGKEIKEQKLKKTIDHSLTKNSNTEKGSGSEYTTKTLITVTKKNDLTDINISEKETFTDSRLPIPFSTETFFQIFGSTETIQKEAHKFENIRKAVISSLGNNNVTKTLPQSVGGNKQDVTSPLLLKNENVKTDLTSKTKDILKKAVKGHSRSIRKKEKVSSKRGKKSDRNVTEINDSFGTNKLEEIRKNSKKMAIERLQSDIEKLKQEFASASKTEESLKLINQSKMDQSINESAEKSNFQKLGESYVNLLENAKKKIASRQKKRAKGIINHKSLSNRDKNILKEILKGNLKNKKSMKTVKEPSTNINYDSIGQQIKNVTTKTLKNNEFKNAGPSENMEKNVPTKSKGKNAPNENKPDLKSDGSSPPQENPPQVKSFDVGYSYSVDMNKGISQPNSQFQESKPKIENATIPDIVNKQFENLNKEGDQKYKTNTLSNLERTINPEVESNVSKNSQRHPMNDGASNSLKRNSMLNKQSALSNMNNDGSIINKKNSEAIVTYAKKIAATIKSQINEKYITRSNTGDHVKPVSPKNPMKKNEIPSLGLKKDFNGALHSLADYKKQVNDKNPQSPPKFNEINVPIKEKVQYNRGNLQENLKPQITLIESHKSQNTNEDYKENFQKDLIEKMAQKIELKNPINYRKSKIKLSSPRSSFKATPNVIKNKSNIDKMPTLDPLKKMKENNNKLPVKALPDRKLNKKSSREQVLSQQSMQSKLVGKTLIKHKSTPVVKRSPAKRGTPKKYEVLESKKKQDIIKNRQDIAKAKVKQPDHIEKINEVQKVIKKQVIQRARSTQENQKASNTQEAQKTKSTKEILKAISMQEAQRAKSTRDILKASSTQEAQKAKSRQKILKANSTQEAQKAKSRQEILKASMAQEAQKTKSTNKYMKANGSQEVQRPNSTQEVQKVKTKQQPQTVNNKVTGISQEIKNKEILKDPKKELPLSESKGLYINLSHKTIEMDQKLLAKVEIEKSAEVIEKHDDKKKSFRGASFPTLLVDIDKMTKEIKPDFDKNNRRTCLVPYEKIKYFPLWNSRKPREPPSPQAVLKVCPSKDPQLKSDLKLFPSVTKILNVTLPKESKDIMKIWWKNMNTELGEKGFRFYYKDEITRGNHFHNLIQDHLLWGRGGSSTPSSLFFKSLGKILDDVKDLSVISSHAVHNTLAYRGVIDCVAKYKQSPVVVEWKRLDHRAAPNLPALESAFQQLSAYIGAVNYDPNYNFQVRGGLLVLAYSDGSDADLFHLKEEDCEKYWQLWLERLYKFHIHMKNNSK